MEIALQKVEQDVNPSKISIDTDQDMITDDIELALQQIEADHHKVVKSSSNLKTPIPSSSIISPHKISPVKAPHYSPVPSSDTLSPKRKAITQKQPSNPKKLRQCTLDSLFAKQ